MATLVRFDPVPRDHLAAQRDGRLEVHVAKPEQPHSKHIPIGLAEQGTIEG